MTKFFWEPKPDITLYELACALGVLLPAVPGLEDKEIERRIEASTDEIRRHFTEE